MLPLDEGLWAVTQEVPAAEFTEDALRSRLADQRQLEESARTHHAVVTAASADGPVVPLPLATLFTDPHRAQAALNDQRPRFLAALDRLTGRTEWAVKVYLRQRGEGRGEAPASSTSTAEASGQAYLKRVRDRDQQCRARQDAALNAARHVHDVAAGYAVASVQRRPHGPEITGRDRTQTLNAAYLVDDAQAPRLVAAMRALGHAPSEAEVEVSGPWVPYSFAEAPDAAPGAGGIGV
ncbi:Gas vesicle synthesis protein GvpL/GvpF [Actinacidiphila yanglinensis]|uniref:Gas vesicle synthesis protein GvpL/GvpF n=2 Tax=Actinacidiphila yanglinensis TaxID=310779 RepID=A0A1H6EEC7_9ACTN|nr:Gas vesicle synthesis protein GvpL/GvpF [Actinacidiphila yanglinensis]